jgi:hypothetical protein
MDSSTIPAPSGERSPEALPRDPRIPWEFFLLAIKGDPEADPLRELFPLRTNDN